MKKMYKGTAELQMAEITCETPRKKSVFYPVFLVLSMLGIAGAVVIGSIYELTQEEQLTLYGSVAAMGVCLLLCLIGMIGNRKRTAGEAGSRLRSDQDMAGESKRRQVEDWFPDEEMLPLEQVISKDMNLELADDKPKVYQPGRYSNETSYNRRSNVIQENENNGNTVFFDESTIEEYKLYAVDKKNKRHIELKKFPFTVGKMAGCVDYVLSDDSVSRIHARFDKQGDKIMITDMNSTNGTYKNGLRMQPQETVEIEPGDEVRFGSLNYCYR